MSAVEYISKQAALDVIQNLREAAAGNFTPRYSGSLGVARLDSFYEAWHAVKALPASEPDPSAHIADPIVSTPSTQAPASVDETAKDRQITELEQALRRARTEVWDKAIEVVDKQGAQWFEQGETDGDPRAHIKNAAAETMEAVLRAAALADGEGR